MNVIGQICWGLPARFPTDRGLYQGQGAEGRWREAVAGGASNDDELWGTWFFLLRLRSADKHAR